jgi:hypothetical protein
MEILKCPYCDAQLEGSETSCASCGKELVNETGQAGEKKGGNKIFGILVILLVLLGGVALMLFTGVLPNPFVGRGTAAIVNGEKISWKDVDQKVEAYTKIYAQSGTGKMDFSTPEGKKVRDAISQQVLNSLIQEKVLLAEVKRENITVSPQDVQGRIDSIKTGMNLSDKDFEAFLQSHAMSMDKLKKRIENEMVITKLIEKGTQGGVCREEWARQINAKASVKTFPR